MSGYDDPRQLVTFLQALLLKDLGFPRPTKEYYTWTGELMTAPKPYDFNHGEDESLISAPEISSVFRWVKKEKRLRPEVLFYGQLLGKYDRWCGQIVDMETGEEIFQGFYDDFLEALGKVIEKLLDTLGKRKIWGT